jgi:DNA-binding MarR family transcriptional regulator
MVSPRTGQRVLELFRDFQNLNRFIVLNTKEVLSLAAAHALVEIHAHAGVDIGSLAAILEMPRTSVATVIDSLSRRRLVSVSTSKIDGRRRSLKLTKRGTGFLRQTDPAVDAHLDVVLSPLDKSDQIVLAHFFGEIADGMGSPPCNPRTEEHLVRHQLRRATRALRLIHADFMGAKLGSPEWQVLSKIKETGERRSISEIAAELGLFLSTTTTICNRLSKRGFTTSRKNPNDKRATAVCLTDVGEKFIQRVEQTMALRLESALLSIPAEELHLKMNIFERVIARE